jgi:hypothetical protein
MEDKFIILLSTNILSMALLELFLILFAKLNLCHRLYVVNNEASFWVVFNEVMCVYDYTN